MLCCSSQFRYFLFKSIIILLLFFLSACSGGGSSDTNATTSNNTTALRVLNVAPSENNVFVTQECGDHGGIAIYTGVDSNANGILDLDEENDLPHVVCNGADGSDGLNGQDGLDGFSGFLLYEPTQQSRITSSIKVSYVLSSEITSLTFTYVLTSGSGLQEQNITLSGSDVTLGIHENVALNGATLLEGDTYNIQISALDLEGIRRDLGTLYDLRVDITPPTLLSAQAIQSEFGKWHVGDHLIFTFSEAIDTSALDTFDEIKTSLADTSTFNYSYFDNAQIIWSDDQTVLALMNLSEVNPSDVLIAGSESFSANALFNPSYAVKDGAGNSDATSSNVELISSGDVTQPSIWITSPKHNGSLSVLPTISYELNEDLSEGKLIVTISAQGSSSDTTLTREWDLDSARLLKGTHIIDFATDGIEALVDGVTYIFSIEGSDGAGNTSFDERLSVMADSTAPNPPDVSKLGVHAYNGTVVLDAGESLGGAGEYLRLYVNGAPYAIADFPAPYSSVYPLTIMDDINVSVGDSISYSLKDEAGNESSQVDDGVIPNAPTLADTLNLAVRVSSSAYTVEANATLSGISMGLHANFDNSSDSFHTGSTDVAGALTLSVDSIAKESVYGGREVYYMYENSNKNLSHYSEQDGAFVETVAVRYSDNDFSTNISVGDDLFLYFSDEIITLYTHPLTYESPIGFGYGTATAGAGGYQWASILSEINIAPVSTGSASSFRSTIFGMCTAGYTHDSGALCFPDESMDNGVYIYMAFNGFSTEPIRQLRVELHPLGTNTILSKSGGHCALPSTTIEADGSSGGLITPDESWRRTYPR